MVLLASCNPGGQTSSGSAAPSPLFAGVSPPPSLPPQAAILPTQFVTIRTGNDGFQHFTLGTAPWFPFGFNYFPNYALQFPTAFPDEWMGPAYNATAIESDLQAMALIGVTCITIEAGEETTPPPHLLDVLALCKKYNIRVILGYPKTFPLHALTVPFVLPTPTPGGSPTPAPTPTPYTIDPETSFDNFIIQDGLASHAEIVAYNIAEEPYLGMWGDGRSSLDGVWSRFIAKEFPGVKDANNAVAPGSIATDATTQGGLNGVLSSASGVTSISMPVQVAAGGASVPCSISMQNMGATGDIWDASVTLRPVFGAGLGITPFPLPSTVAPGATVTIPFSYQPPAMPGRYRLRLSLFHQDSPVSSQRFGTWIDWEVSVVASGQTVSATIAQPFPVLGASDSDLNGAFLPDCLPSNYRSGNLANLFRRCIDIEASTRWSQVANHIRSLDPNHFISADQGFDGNGSAGAVPTYPMELQVTGFAFDFHGCENYYIDSSTDPTTIGAGVSMIQAYSRWASGGKPVTWSEEGFLYQGPVVPTPTPLLRCPAACEAPTPAASPTPTPPPVLGPPDAQGQAIYHGNFINAMRAAHGDGLQIWTFAGGDRQSVGKDWGVIDAFPSLILRPAAATLQTLAGTAESTLPPLNGSVVDLINPQADPRGFAGIFFNHLCNASAAAASGQLYTVQGIGAGTTSLDPPTLMSAGGLPQFLFGFMPKVQMMIGNSGTWFEVRDGNAYAVPANTPVSMWVQVVNMGDATWSAENVTLSSRTVGVGAISFLSQRLPSDVARLQSVTFGPFQITSGLKNAGGRSSTVYPLQLQMVAAPQNSWNPQTAQWITGATRIFLCAY